MPSDSAPTGASIVDSRPRGLGEHEVGPIAYGCWRLTTGDVTEARLLIESALDEGMNLIDAADVYGLDFGGSGFGSVEEMLGRVLRDSPSLRDRMVLATKGGIDPGVPYDSSDRYLRSACEASLRRLGVDRIDVYMIHRPDWFAHPAELATTLQQLVDDGKVAAVGVSNFGASQYDALAAHSDAPIVAHQFEFSPVMLAAQHDGTFDRCARDSVAAMAWSPLAGGRLVSGDGVRPELLAVLDRLAEREGVDRATIAVAFVLAQRVRPIAIIGSQRPDRIAQLRGAAEVALGRRDCYAIIEASIGETLP